MPSPVIIVILSLTSFVAYIFSFNFVDYLPQAIALLALITILVKGKPYFIYFVSLIVNLLVFSTGGLNSPLFFLIYFLLFVIALQSTPSVTLAYSLFIAILLTQSLNSPQSLLPLISLTLISPLVWFTSRLHLDNTRLYHQVAVDETNFFLWLSLKFKTGITKIIDSSSLLLSHPHLSPPEKEELHSIKDSAKNLLNSANRFLESSSEDEK